MAARIYRITADDEQGTPRNLWVAEADNQILATENSEIEAAIAARQRILGCAELARAQHLPARYIKRLLALADVFRPV